MEAASWLELGEIYLSMCLYSDAVHCFEELVLLDPRNAAHHSHLAEVYYSLGEAIEVYFFGNGLNFVKVARKI